MKSFWISLALLLIVPIGWAMGETPQEYAAALGQVQAALNRQSQAMRVEQVPTGDSPSLVAQRVLAPIHSVGLPGYAPQIVDTARLVDAVKTAEAIHDPGAKAAAFDALNQQITTLREEVAPIHKRGETPPDPAQTVRSARALLAGNVFASDPPPPPGLAERFAAWLDKLFAGWNTKPAKSPTFNGPNINPEIILDIIRGILIVAGVAVFILLVSLIIRTIERRGAKSKPLALDEEEAILVETRDNNSLLALAEQQAKAGDYRRAFRLVYLASLVALDTGGVLRFDRSKTNWEYLRALRTAGRGDVYQAMTPLTREFDQVWYGFGRADASHYARALAQYQALLAAPQSAVNT